jgi:glycosyltransferase involved in cell wall biosynthesis
VTDTEPLPSLRLALVVQRYGEAVAGGAEYHCRLVAEHLAKRHKVEVVTSCARDYITWANELPAGIGYVNGVPVRRFKVRRPRDPDRFGRISKKVFQTKHEEKDELLWLVEQGPYSPSLLRYLKKSRKRYDYFVFFSYRYYHSYHGIRALADRSLLVPTAERDEVLSLSIFRPFFRKPRAIVYNSFEERRMIWEVTGNEKVLGDVVGVGTEVPDRIDAAHFTGKHRVNGRYAVFIGRVDENKGCRRLFQYLRRYWDETGSKLKLVLVGGKTMEIPDHPLIYYAGFLPENEKWGALAGAELLIMPSDLESLSMVTLEAWAAGKPVLANGGCEVLRDQCIRSNAGLFYTDYYEFRESLALLERDARLRTELGRHGRRFFHDHYRWEVIEGKYHRMLSSLSKDDEGKGIPSPEPVGLAGRLGDAVGRWLG